LLRCCRRKWKQGRRKKRREGCPPGAALRAASPPRPSSLRALRRAHLRTGGRQRAVRGSRPVERRLSAQAERGRPTIASAAITATLTQGMVVCGRSHFEKCTHPHFFFVAFWTHTSVVARGSLRGAFVSWGLLALRLLQGAVTGPGFGSLRVAVAARCNG